MLLVSDFHTHLYQEIIESIERTDANTDKLDEAIQAAESQAKGYLSRFDIDELFAATGEDRDKMLLVWLKDLAVWQFTAIANPNINLEYWSLRYDQAIKELGKIQSGKVVPHGWPPAINPESDSTFFHVKSNPRRETNY